MKDLLLGIDVGTYSSKATLTDLRGAVLHTAVAPHEISIPRPGHVEQDADKVWWNDLCKLCRELWGHDPEYPARIAGVAVSAIGPCLLALDAAMKPLRPAILYGVDVRADQEIKDLEAKLGREEIYQHSWMSLSSQAIGPKLLWLRKHAKDTWSRAAMFTTASSYLTYRLTGNHRIDRHTASHFIPLYDPATGTWNDRLDSGLLDVSALPELGWSDELAGTVTARAAAETGLAIGTPVAVGAVDALSEAISVGATRPGDLMIMYGSTAFFVLAQERPTPDHRVWSVAGAFQGQYNLAAGMSTTGSLTHWFKRELARDLGDSAFDSLFQSASQVDAGSNGLLVLPYFSGERTPINDPKASGIIAGLNLSHTREHLFRAVLEGVGYGIRHNLDTFASVGAKVQRIFAVGGGARTDAWLQIVSDITGIEQTAAQISIGASYGDAFLAGCAAGLLEPEDIHRWVSYRRAIEPRAMHRSTYDDLYAQYIRLYERTQPIMHDLYVHQRNSAEKL